MKTPGLILLLLTSLSVKAQTITITNNSGTNSITCLTQSINMTASCVGFSTTSTFTWVSPAATLTGSNVNISLPSTYTAMTWNGNMLVMQTFTVFQNTVPPVSSISSTFLVTNGTVVPTMTMVAINPTVNIQHQVYSPIGGTLVANTTTMYYSPGGPGTYTHCIFWLVNGCSSCKTFTVSENPSLLPEYAEEDAIKVFRDLSGDLLIKGTKSRLLSLSDLYGRRLRNFTLDEDSGFSIRVTDLEPGIYILVSEIDRRKLKVVIESHNSH